NQPLVTAAPVLSLPVPATPTGTASPTLSPSPRVFLVTPSPTPTPTDTGTPTETPAPEPLGITLTPSSGPNDTDITVDGQGFTPGATVDLKYFNAVGGGTGSAASALVDDRGRFTTILTAHDDQGIPGQHQVTAEEAGSGLAAQATFSATG
ncbi:MAG: hypothetical protein JWN31_1289, partial [Frankiales bacterium]|nr:hypothetical protein [Frankiales bacterium]